MMKGSHLLALVFTIFTLQQSQANEVVDQYLNMYAPIAIQEMHRTKIPASIKLAQGLLESNWGRSTLAVNANNHFGIKCGGDWAGQEFYRKDDDRNRKGKIIPSCFRKYKNPAESYMAHSEFLRDPKKKHRYGFLFEYDTKDYKSWAKGLRKAGYATDPKYPNKLIDIIEKYELYRFDQGYEPSSPPYEDSRELTEADKQSSESYKPSREFKPVEKPAIATAFSLQKNEVNGVRGVVVSGEIDAQTLSKELGVETKNLLKYNDHINLPGDMIKNGDYIYVESKKRDYKGEEDTHLVLEGETIESISQLYGVRVSNLRYLNRIAKTATPLVGQRINLKKAVGKRDRPLTRRVKQGGTLDF